MSCRLVSKVLLFCLTIIAPASWSVEPRTEHTFGLAEGESRPAATLEDAHWLVGNWEGTAFGSQFEEAWASPSAGTMVGLFKLFDDSGVSMYEIMWLNVEEGSLSLKEKHFHGDFTAWEEKADYVNFRLVAMEENALHFGGISFYRRSDDVIDAYIVMREGGSIKEYPLKYRRADKL